jgi:hypothetical protein
MMPVSVPFQAIKSVAECEDAESACAEPATTRSGLLRFPSRAEKFRCANSRREIQDDGTIQSDILLHATSRADP